MDNGIISKERVKNFGEVFTPDSIVNDMLDLVKEHLPEDESYITKTFLEPACGDGQFLIRILYRKLLQVQKLPMEKRQFALVKVLSSIYGVDIQEDNVIKARDRMFRITLGEEVTSFDLNNKTQVIKIGVLDNYTEQLKNVMKWILEHNIIVGNTLDGSVELTSYRFNDSNEHVELANTMINNIEFEYNQYEVYYMDLAGISTDNDEESYEF
jgi:hypothetical protein